MKYRKKPVEIEAWQFPFSGIMTKELAREMGMHDTPTKSPLRYIDITTLEGVMRANPGDYIIRGGKGELYPCKPDIFDVTYEPVQ